MKKTFTKGPWTQLEEQVYANFESENPILICEIDSMFSNLTGQEREANVKLIAAAPELLESLKVFVDKYETAPDNEKFGAGLTNGDFIKAREILKKALE